MEFISWEFSSSRPWYLIPYTIIVNPLESYSGSLIECDDGVYVYSRAMNLALSCLTNITSEIWYKRFILGVDDNEVIKCTNCGVELEFVSISKGYSNGTGAGYRDHWFCSQTCSKSYYGSITADRLNSIDSQVRGRFTQWMNMGDENDECIFYLGIDGEGYLKYGVTSDLISRSWMYGSKFLTMHSILVGTRRYVGELERDLKIHLNQISEHVEFSLLHEIINFIKQYKLKFR